MRTRTAVLAHSVVGMAQAGAVAAGAAHGIPWWGQLLIQFGLLFGHGALAQANSNTDSNGNPQP